MNDTDEFVANDAVPDADRDAMHRQFEESPGDFAAYGVMADKLDELGYEALAHAYRWMWKRQKFPHRRERYCSFSGRPGRKVNEHHRWAWYVERASWTHTQGTLPQSLLVLHSLPRLLIPGEQKVYRSHTAAVQALAEWLRRLKGIHDIEPARKGL